MVAGAPAPRAGQKPSTIYEMACRFVAMRWRFLLTPPLDGADNMALDEALMQRARDSGEGVVRVYAWSAPTLSLGRNQRAIGVYTAERARALGVQVVRRPTGGRALLHHREITYSVAAPAPAHESLARSYRAINLALLAALRGLGVHTEIAVRRERLPPPGSAPCFELPADGELMLGGRKLVGSAQFREHGALLQHGSILVHDDQPMVSQLASVSLGVVAPAATLAQALGRDPSPEEFATLLFDVVRRDWDAGASEVNMDGALRDAMARARPRFTDDRWTWRR